MAQRSIGVFDSGVGGLSVLSEIRQHLATENLIYLADSAAAPYGDKTSEFVSQRVLKIADFFHQQNVKLIVVACNTATTTAVKTLRQYCQLPIVAIEPAIKPAAALSQNGVIGVMATQQTIQNQRLLELKEQFAKQKQVVFQACPGLVEMVEQGKQESEECQALLQDYLQPMKEKSIDTLVLGCTHYPFLSEQITQILGPSVSLVDPAEAVARQVRNVLAGKQLLTERNSLGTSRFYTSADPQLATPVISKLWGEPVRVNSCIID